ncbi:Amidohydro-rel domain-containing protein [Mycena chlorophos]|uniref:Amidohydro-rel domain-containing protein n=1 Tax=Mycena chlorophos TaxID=658473 RepID=A0A8H6VSK7_MYCCL|nr:Amidohydro-rel domain-containing protein [Mycena chlorophos]
MHLAPAVISFLWHVLVGAALQQPFETSKIDPIAQGVLNRALADNIDLSVHSFTAAALADIVFWSHFEPGPEHEYALEANATGAIDTHAHYVPEWYAKLRGDNTKWSLEEHLSLMKCRGIATTIFDIPNPNIFPKDANATVAIARLLNENLAALSKALPRKFGFFATVPLPYVDEAIVETTYALKHLNALAVALSSNHEGQYLGDPLFRPFFSVLNDLQAIVFLHPNEPLIEVDGSLIKANPTRYSSIPAEFYFETGIMNELHAFFLTASISTNNARSYLISDPQHIHPSSFHNPPSRRILPFHH